MKRLFVALDIPGDVKSELARQQESLRAAGVRLRWTRTDQMHLTLVFLGAIDEGHVETIAEAIGRAGSGTGEIQFGLGDVGAFPNPAEPRVVWIGLGGDVAKLRELQLRLSAALADFVPATESRPYSPHLTLGRTPKDANRGERRAVGGALGVLPTASHLSWRSREVVLYESVSAAGGVQYVPLATTHL